MVHEIGHNLGLYHDFGGSVPSDGTPCSGVGTFMDYAVNNGGDWKNHVKWSKCSEEFLTSFYNKVEESASFCLLPGTNMGRSASASLSLIVGDLKSTLCKNLR